MKTMRYVSAVAGIAMALAAGMTQAASVESLLFADTLFEDDSQTSHWVLDVNTGQYSRSTAGQIMKVGDRLRGIFQIPKLQDNLSAAANLIGLGTPNEELTGIFDVTVGLACNQGAAIAPGCAGINAGDPFGNFAFIPTAGFGLEIEAITGLDLTEVGMGFALFTDGTPDYAVGGATCTSDAFGGDCESHVTDGSLFFTSGFAGDPDENIVGLFLPADPTGFGGSNGTSQAQGNFNYALTMLDNFTGRELGAQRNCNAACGPGGDGFVDIVGSGSAVGTLSGNPQSPVTPYSITDDTDFSVNFVPEPGTLALLGLGLLGAGASARRRR